MLKIDRRLLSKEDEFDIKKIDHLKNSLHQNQQELMKGNSSRKGGQTILCARRGGLRARLRRFHSSQPRARMSLTFRKLERWS